MRPTGVTRHALAQLERLARRPEIAFRLLTGRMTHPDGLAYWESLELSSRRELPLRTRDLLRWWRIQPWPPIEWWTGPVDWVYCPAEFFVPTRQARRAVTSHDVLQNLRFEPPRRRELLAQRIRAGRPDPVGLAVQHRAAAGGIPRLSGSRRLRAQRRGRPVFRAGRPPTSASRVRADLGLPPQVPYLLSVANFQPRKNLVRLIKAAARLPEVARGDLALVLIGTGDEDEAPPVREAIAAGRPPRVDPHAGLPPGPGALGRLCRGHGAGLPLALRELRHPGRRGDGAGRFPSHWPTRRPCPRSAARPAGTSTRTPRTRSRAPCRSARRPRRTRPPRHARQGSIAAHYRWQAANDLLVEALLSRRRVPT